MVVLSRTKVGTIDNKYDVVIIGAGQAGLAIGYFLTQQKRRFVILDAAAEIGDAWRHRYDSLVLFTPAWFSGLPGLPFPAPPDHFPTREEVVAYLRQYAKKFELPLHLNSKVVSARPSGGRYELVTGTASYLANQMVVATGPFQEPFVPPIAGHWTALSFRFTAARTAAPLSSHLARF